ncbi:response regulator [candidate division CSSED10-310 bacterium]|uniref:Response regulator n=1 Tax=candidate division CSSED10-310 bacterium TaxID=2855610 RepID=A0ABV6Z2D0_UNCC1
MAGEKILLVDDEQEFTEVLSQRLETRGMKVDVARNGLEALKKIEDHVYDVIIMDMVMPELNGIEALKRIRKSNPELQIILLTGHATLEKGIEAVKLGAMDFLEKPADIKKLMNKITEGRSKKMLHETKQLEDKIKDILSSKGW